VSSISVSKETTAAPEALWRVVVGLDDWVDVVGAIEVVERLDDRDGFGLGTTWRETRTMFGKKATEDMEVTDYEEGSPVRDGGRVARLEVVFRDSGRRHRNRKSDHDELSR